MTGLAWRQQDGNFWRFELTPQMQTKFEELWIQEDGAKKLSNTGITESIVDGILPRVSPLVLKAEKLTVNTSGKYREVYSPAAQTKVIFRTLIPFLNGVFSKIEHDKVAYGFIPKRSCVEQAKQHIGYQYTISLDIKNFFDNITPDLVKEHIDDDLISLLFLNGAPRQGFPTSPVISNIAFNIIDLEISKFLDSALIEKASEQYKGSPIAFAALKRRQTYGKTVLYAYTRYADDLSISVNNPDVFDIVINGLESILRKFGFELNEKKTKILYAKNGRRIICGVGVDDRGIYPTRKTLKKIRAATHQERFSSLLGLRAWAYSIEKKLT